MSRVGHWLMGMAWSAAVTSPCAARPQPAVLSDRRTLADRLDSGRNPNHSDDSFLNAVGAVWPFPVAKSGAGYPAYTGDRAATGFLIDPCHVLTNLHVVYDDALVADPPLGRAVTFAVGQTGSDKDRGALQGLKYLAAGTVIAQGNTLIVDGLVHHPEEDWAVIRLAASVDPAIAPMTIAAVDLADLPSGANLSSAGYPSDHRSRRGDGFKLKDLWRSEGQVVEASSVSGTTALIQTTIQTTPGNSGGPLFGDFAGRPHLVIGMAQSLRGNGIDVSAGAPNVQVLFTANTIARITAAQTQDPCR